ncbi:MAG: COX15/CtaA family protein, partial [bacterium]
MRIFQRFAFVSTFFTYLVIFTGGLVRVTGAGLGCPDWPKCFGSWLPPLSYTDLPPDIDPTQVNLVLTWIEYLNRVL